MTKKSTINKFIKKSNIIHNNKYDYSKFVYTGALHKGIIICPIHGEFEQVANNHLNGNGCNLCRNIQIGNRFRKNIDYFIEKAKIVYGDMYDYSKFVYLNNRTHGIIICKIHGSFKQRPDVHLAGYGCKKCNSCNSPSNKMFVEKSKEIHGYKYDYSKFVYVSSRIKGIITCLKHGDFLKTPNKHLRGQGCPICTHNISKSETEWLDSLNIKSENRQKRILGYRVDAYQDGVVYEFLGDFYHGNPNKYKQNNYNIKCHKTFGQLYRNTLNRFNRLKSHGYRIYWIWESDWLKSQKLKC